MPVKKAKGGGKGARGPAEVRLQRDKVQIQPFTGLPADSFSFDQVKPKDTGIILP